MFVLERKPQQAVVVLTPAGPIEITLLRCAGNRAKLGFTAPREVPIHRGEVHQRLAAESLPCPAPSATELAGVCRELLEALRETRPDSPLLQRAEALCKRLEPKAAA